MIGRESPRPISPTRRRLAPVIATTSRAAVDRGRPPDGAERRACSDLSGPWRCSSK